MFNVQKYLRHAVLALGLAAASLTASATVVPTYHISASDTASQDIASMDLVFSSINTVGPVKARLSHFTGTPLVELDRQGDVSENGGVYFISNAGSYNDLYVEVDGPFGFNLNFDADFLGFNNIENNNGLFSIVLYNSLGDIIGNPGGELQFSVTNTGVDPSEASKTSSLLSLTEVTAADVPEPTDWMLMLTGLVFVVAITRVKGRANARATAEA